MAGFYSGSGRGGSRIETPEACNSTRQSCKLTMGLDDIVAVKLIDTEENAHFILTWGRIFGGVDPLPLLAVVSSYLEQFGLNATNGINVCSSLQEASGATFFYEGLFFFAQKRIPFGKTYEKWRCEKVRLLKKGKEMFYLGQPTR